MKKTVIIMIAAWAAAAQVQGRTKLTGQGWELTKNSSGVKVYQRENIKTGIHEFLGVTTVRRPCRQIYDAVRDVSTNRYWMADCIHSELLKQEGKNSFVAYYITAPPWPVEKRDSVIRVSLDPACSQGRMLVKMKSLSEKESANFKKRNPGLVRVEQMDGYVILEKKGPAETEVQFFVAGKPGGSVPDIIARWGGWMIPWKTLRGLKKYLSAQLSDK